MNYKGVIIEESLGDKSVLADVQIIETKVEEVTESYKIHGFRSGLFIQSRFPKRKSGNGNIFS